MSIQSRRASNVGSQVDGQSPHLSIELNDILTGEAIFNSDRALSLQEHAGNVPPVKPEEIRTPSAPVPLENKKDSLDRDTAAVEESSEARLERLGRQRPEVFDSIWSEIGFVFSISMSQVLTV
jgi:hypothetical protein